MMTRRHILAGAMASLAAACSPLAALNSLGPRDRNAGRVAHDLRYGDHPRQRYDLFAPRGAGPWPVLVFFYGGGWDSGSKDLYGWAGQALASRGYLVAVPDYRLSPEVHFPVFIEDAARAVAAVRDEAARFQGEARRLGVLGHSAGAHLAMMITLDPQYMRAADAPEAIKAAAGLSGPYEFLPFDVAASINAFGRAPDPALTQPVTFARADAPPIWLGHGTIDRTVHAEDSEILADRLASLGAPVELKLYPGIDHATTVAALSPLFRGRVPVLDDLSGFFGRVL